MQHAERRRIPLRTKLLFAFAPLMALLVVAELAMRIARDPTHFGSFRDLRLDQAKRGYPARPDPQLGYAPIPGHATERSRWGTRVHIDADGLRSNGPGAPGALPGIIAVGDSFTFGDQVHDEESWPAQLAHRLDQRVWNGGVFGYSLTQAALRAEALLQGRQAAWVVLSIIPDDIQRSEFRRRYTSVPWFEIRDGKLVLCNVPVQEHASPEEAAARRFKDLLGHSALVDGVLAEVAKAWWVTDQKEQRIDPPVRGADLAPRIVDRLHAACTAAGARLLVVVQGEGPHLFGSDAMLEHARTRGIPTLDLIAAYRDALAADPSVRDRWFDGHMTAAGNGWVAERIAETLRTHAPR